MSETEQETGRRRTGTGAGGGGPQAPADGGQQGTERKDREGGGLNIRVRLTREENRRLLGAEEAVLDLEVYVRGVVASEIGNSAIEACRAQAVAARTNAFPAAREGRAVTDTSPQAFRASRLTGAYAAAKAAEEDTAGEVLFFGERVADPASFSAGNGGRTTSSKDRWGSERPWLIAQADPWDSGGRTGHGVGMSQRGIRKMAGAGKSYREMLAFYYPGTRVAAIFGSGETDKGGEKLANVRASDLVRDFNRMVEERWAYVENGCGRGGVDCSGAFAYWYRQHGAFMYHGSNTMWRQYTTRKGRIGELPLVPGMAVFRHRDDGKEPERYQGDGIGNFYHVGLYVGDGQVAEAQGKKNGCIRSAIGTWSHCARLKSTLYDLEETARREEDGALPEGTLGTVRVKSGRLNVRGAPTTSAPVLGKLSLGEQVTLTGRTGGWFSVRTASGLSGFCCADYIQLPGKETEREDPPAAQAGPVFLLTARLSGEDARRAGALLREMGIPVQLCEVKG